LQNVLANFLDQDLAKIRSIQKEKYVDLPNRNYENITLDTNNFNKVKFAISYPKNITKNENILILLDGLQTGKNALKYIPNPDNFIIIAYEYVKDMHMLQEKKVLLHLPSIRKTVLDVPFQILAVYDWIKNQSWNVEKQNIVLIGVSFGAIFIPATMHLAQKNNIDLNYAILAFGGADLYDIFLANLKKYTFLKKPLAYLASKVFNPIDPKYHLPNIHGNFLIINGIYDKNIPLKSALLLQKLTPEPKTIINLDVPHIEPQRKKIINQIVDISFDRKRTRRKLPFLNAE
jgi:hypothetical protein